MKTTFFRQTITSVCIAAIISMGSPALAADANSSIEINLDVLNNVGQHTLTLPESASPTEKPVKSDKKPVASKPKHTAKPAKPKKPKVETATPAEPNPVPTVELPIVKDLPAELTPAPSTDSIIATPPSPIEAAKPTLPTPVPLPETPNAGTVPLPDASPLPATPAPKLPDATTPDAKPGLGDQLSNFLNGKPETPPATPPATPALAIPPVENALPVPPALPATIPPAPPSPQGTVPATPNEMGSPLPDSTLSPLPAAAPSIPPAPPLPPSATPDAAAPVAPAVPPAPKEPLSMNIEAIPALPSTLPSAPPPAPGSAPVEPVGAVTPPPLPNDPSLLPSAVPPAGPGDTSGLPPAPPLPPMSDLSTPPEPGKSLPSLSGITGEEKPAEAAAMPAELPKPGEPLLPTKTAEVPDLAPVPETMKGDLPALPSGRQQDLLATAKPAATASKDAAAVAEMDIKANASDPDTRLVFNETETDVPPSLNSQLDTLAQKLAGSPTAHVNIYAYAGGPKESGIYPKRVSLARGIAVRNYLTTNKGIDIERVNVRALGNKSDGGPQERVDLFIVKK